MATCDICGEEAALPFKCNYCGGTFCSNHRLPENHSCKRFAEARPTKQEQLNRKVTPDQAPEAPPPVEIRYEIRTHQPKRRPSFFKYPLLRRSSMVILLLLFVVFIGQLIVQAVLGPTYYRTGDHNTFLYYLTPSQATALARPWTLVTSIFLHAGFLHLFVNALVLFSFGPVLETKIGRRRFLYIFLGAGIIAGAAQILVLPPDVVVLGASGAILGTLGTLTVLAPRLPVLLFFFIPMPLWVVSLGFGVLSAILAFFTTGGSIANMAHFTGLVVGLIYGYKLRREERKGRRYLLRFFNPWI